MNAGDDTEEGDYSILAPLLSGENYENTNG
jgi:hypothetical protein